MFNLNSNKQLSPTVMVFAVIALAISGFVSTDIYLPSFPSMVSHFHVRPSDIQFSLTLFVLMFSLSSFLFGLLSDRYGRKPMLLIGISMYVVGCLFTLDTSSIYFLYFGRFLQGLGIGAASTLSRIMLRDRFDEHRLSVMFSWVAVVVVMVPAIAPFLGGYLQEHFNFIGSLLFMLIYGILILLMVLLIIPETNQSLIPHATSPKYIGRKVLAYFSEPQFIFSVLTNGSVFSLVVCYSLVSPFIFQDHYGYSPTQYGLIILLIAFGMVIGVGVNRIMRRFLPAQQVILIGIVVALCMNSTLLALSLLGDITAPLIAILLFIANIGVIFVLPNNAALVFSIFKNGTGLVGAVYGALRMLIGALIGLLVSALHIVGTIEMASLLTFISLAALTFTLLANVLPTRVAQVKV